MAVTGDNSLFFKTGLDNSGLATGAQGAVSIISNMASGISKIDPFTTLAIGATTAFAIISKQAYEMAKEFEHAMKEVETISASTQANFDKIATRVFDISKINPDKPKALAEAYYQIVSAGYDGEKGLKLLEISAKAATAGVTDTKTAADGLTTVMNAFKIEAEDSEKVADIFFNTVRLGKTTFGELADNISTVAPLAAASNISFTEISAALATLTKQGVPTAQAMTQIRSAINALNENLTDGWSNSLTLQEGLQLLYEEADGSQSKLLELTGRVEGMSAVLGIAGDNLKGATKDLESYKDIVGATAKAQETLLNDNTNQWAVFSNKIKGSTKDIGDGWLRLSTSLAKGLNSLFEDTTSKSYKLKNSFDEQRVKVFELKGELGKLNIASEERKELIEEMKKLFPDYLTQLSNEKISNEELLSILDKVNTSYKERYKYQKRINELQDAEKKQADIEFVIEDIEDDFKIKLAKLRAYADKHSVEIKVDDPEFNYESIVEFIKGTREAGKQISEINAQSGAEFSQMASTLAINYFKAEKINPKLKEQSAIVNEIRERNERLFKEDLKNTQTRLEAIDKINKATSEGEIIEYKNTGFDDLTDAYKKRIVIIEQLEEISSVKKLENLKTYLNSENEEIQKAAELRKEALTISVKPDEVKDNRTEIEKFKDTLKAKSKEYKDYEKARLTIGKESADKLFEDLASQGNTYEIWLVGMLGKFDGIKDKTKAILSELAGSGFKFNAVQIEALQNEIEKLTENFKNDRSDFLKPKASNVDDIIAQVERDEFTIARIKKLKIDELEAYGYLKKSKEYENRRKEIDKEEAYLKKLSKERKNESILELPESKIDEYVAKYSEELNNLQTLTYSELTNLVDEVNKLVIDEKALAKLGLSAEQIKALLVELELFKKGIETDSNNTKVNQGIEAAYLISDILAQSGDQFTQKLGEGIGVLADTVGVLTDKTASNAQKVSGIVGAAIYAGNLLKGVRTDRDNEGVIAQQEINKGLLDQLQYEKKINEIRRDRAEIERNSSAFIDSNYKNDFRDALQQQIDEERNLSDTMEALAENGIFSQEGIGKRLLFGTKTKDFSFSIKDILGDLKIDDYYDDGGLLFGGQIADPLSIFGGYSDRNAQQDSLNKLRSSFEDVLTSMGKTSSDMAQFSTEEWLDFFTIMESSGKITDETTKAMLTNAKDALADYQEATEEMKNIISEFAGQLGNDLSDALVTAFQNGTDAADEFAKSVNEVINKLFLNQLIDSQFQSLFDDLQEDMLKSMKPGGDQSWIDDIQKFANGVSPAMDQAIEAMRIFNNEMQSVGYDGFGAGNVNSNSLSGAIKNITEDTANVMAGTLNAIRIDTREGLEIAENSLKELVRIGDNTEYNKYLESMDTKLSNIETALG